MSDFGESLFDLLPVHSSLQNSDNPGRKVIDNTVGEWFDHYDIDEFYDNLFIDTATGAYLDLFGRDYGVTRQTDESDEDYRTRVIQEKLDHLTPQYLEELYGLTLYHAIGGFSTATNTLTSDNPYSTDYYMAIKNYDIKKILDKKFIMGTSIVWYDGTTLDYLINTSNVDILKNYSKLYSMSNCFQFFKDDTTIKKVKLTSDSITNANQMFKGCTGLVDAELILSNASVNNIFEGCTNLVNVVLDAPEANYIDFSTCSSLVRFKANVPTIQDYSHCFDNCISLEYIDIVIPSSLVSGFKSYVLGLNLSNLSTFIVNGEEVEL